VGHRSRSWVIGQLFSGSNKLQRCLHVSRFQFTLVTLMTDNIILLGLAAKKAGFQQTFKHTQDGLTDKEIG